MRKIIKALLVCMTLVLVLVAVTSCDLGTQIKQNICERKGHTMEAIGEKLATCTEDGYSSGVVCSNCGYAERQSFKLDAKGHDIQDVAAKAPTCTEDGYNAHKACTRCDLTEGKEVIPATAHALTVDVEALEPTCAKDGYTAHKSCVCGETTEGKETVPATGDHKYETAVEALDPTCAEDGYTAHNVCACGAKDENYEVIPATEDHQFDENALFVGLAPTCTEKGMWAGYCLGCGKGFYVAYIDALGHTDENDDGICDVCKATLEAPHEHSYESVVTAPTCTEAGYTTYTCACGDTYTGDEVAATGHDYKYDICSACGEVDPAYASVTHRINFSIWETFDKETYADGDIVKYNDIFTFIYSKNAKVDGSNKSWDDFAGTLRYSFGTKTPTGKVPNKGAIQITVDGAYTIKLWYVAGGDGRYFALLDSTGAVLSETTKETTKNGQGYAELIIPAAGTYYLGTPGDNNYLFQIELVAHAHTLTDVEGKAATCTEDGYTAHKVCACGYVEGKEVVAAGHTWDDADATIKTCTVCGEHVNPDFAGGKGTAEAPYLISTPAQLANISNYYDTYKYYKVADDVTTLDMTGVGKINLHGSFDGNDVELVNLTTALFERVGYQNSVETIKISNVVATMNNIDGRAFVRNIFNAGTTTFENVTLHGYIEGLYNMGSFYNYGTTNYDGTGASYTVEFVDSTSDLTIVCTSGNIAGGFLGHSYEGTGNSFTMSITNSSFTGKIYTTNGKGNLYFAMTSDWYNANNHFIVDGEEISFNNGNIPAASNLGKINVVLPTVGENAYEVSPVEGAESFVVYLNAQVTAYDEDGYKITNKAGLTWPLGNFGLDELAALGLITDAEIVNGTDHDYGYTLEDGVLTIYSGRSASYESGNVYLQVNQYDAEGNLLATGTLTVYVIEHNHTFVGTSCTTAGACNCGAKENATGHDMAAATCTVPSTCKNGCGHTEGEALGHVDENGDYKCDSCSTKMLPADGTALTIEQALTIAKMQAHNTYTTQKYYITGVINEVYNTTYGNMYIEDAEGNEICIYGLYSADGKTRYDAMSYKPVVGDEVTVYTVLGMYNTTCQGKSAWLDEVVAHEHDYKSVVTDPTCTKGGYTTHTCTICNGYTIDTEVDALGHTTDNGVCERCEQTIGGDAPAYEKFTADFNTVTSTNSSYVKSTTTSGWVATNCAVMGGGTSDSNPKFKVFGDASTRAFTMNGKTSAKGSIVSPTLTGGISAITFNYTNCFGESNGVDITITIKQNGKVVATKKLDNNSVTKLTAYTFEWDLAAEGVAVTGNFTIEITNNSPTNSTSNKDRVSIWNLEWTNNPTA